MASTTRLTIEDFERLPAEEARGRELVDGELIEMPGNTLKHNSLQGFLFGTLWLLVGKQRLGTVLAEQEYDFGGNAHAPDVSFFGVYKQAFVDQDRRVQRFVPDLAIEIVSQNDTFNSLVRKKDRYRQCGTREVWIISQDSQEVYVYSDHGNRILTGQDELNTDLIPGFSIMVAELLQYESN
jgi:Uma2 family endonuclease